MNDETSDELMKRTREWLQSCVNAATRSGVPEEADLEAFLLAHINSKPARLAAALEEQREAWRQLDEVRTERDALRAENEKLMEAQRLGPVGVLGREVTTLRARVAELERERDEVTVTLSTAVMWTVAPELMAANHKRAAQEAFDALERLRAQVAAARAVLEETESAGGLVWPTDVLRAMDEAKP